MSFVDAIGLKNELFMIDPIHLKKEIKDFAGFKKFIESMIPEYSFPYSNEEDYVKYISESEEYKDRNIKTYEDIKNLILTAFHKTSYFVVEENERNGALFIAVSIKRLRD